MSNESERESLSAWRARINDVDARILELLNERTRIVEEIGRIKQNLNLPVYEPKREDEVYANVIGRNRGPLPSDAVKRVFERIIDEMRALQRMRRSAAPDSDAN
ncbi:MAG: chorismate mutase [Bryobacteraceae bacterium]